MNDAGGMKRTAAGLYPTPVFPLRQGVEAVENRPPTGSAEKNQKQRDFLCKLCYTICAGRGTDPAPLSDERS